MSQVPQMQQFVRVGPNMRSAQGFSNLGRSLSQALGVATSVTREVTAAERRDQREKAVADQIGVRQTELQAAENRRAIQESRTRATKDAIELDAVNELYDLYVKREDEGIRSHLANLSPKDQAKWWAQHPALAPENQEKHNALIAQTYAESRMATMFRDLTKAEVNGEDTTDFERNFIDNDLATINQGDLPDDFKYLVSQHMLERGASFRVTKARLEAQRLQEHANRNINAAVNVNAGAIFSEPIDFSSATDRVKRMEDDLQMHPQYTGNQSAIDEQIAGLLVSHAHDTGDWVEARNKFLMIDPAIRDRQAYRNAAAIFKSNADAQTSAASTQLAKDTLAMLDKAVGTGSWHVANEGIARAKGVAKRGGLDDRAQAWLQEHIGLREAKFAVDTAHKDTLIKDYSTGSVDPNGYAYSPQAISYAYDQLLAASKGDEIKVAAEMSRYGVVAPEIRESILTNFNLDPSRSMMLLSTVARDNPGTAKLIAEQIEDPVFKEMAQSFLGIGRHATPDRVSSFVRIMSNSNVRNRLAWTAEDAEAARKGKLFGMDPTPRTIGDNNAFRDKPLAGDDYSDKELKKSAARQLSKGNRGLFGELSWKRMSDRQLDVIKGIYAEVWGGLAARDDMVSEDGESLHEMAWAEAVRQFGASHFMMDHPSGAIPVSKQLIPADSKFDVENIESELGKFGSTYELSLAKKISDNKIAVPYMGADIGMSGGSFPVDRHWVELSWRQSPRGDRVYIARNMGSAEDRGIVGTDAGVKAMGEMLIRDFERTDIADYYNAVRATGPGQYVSDDDSEIDGSNSKLQVIGQMAAVRFKNRYGYEFRGDSDADIYLWRDLAFEIALGAGYMGLERGPDAGF